MDNLSHSLVGLAVGELVHRSLPAEANPADARTRRRLLLSSCWLASNVPDLDILLSSVYPAPLGYLLFHRGHTHTLLYAIPQALLLAALLWSFWPGARRVLASSVGARLGLALSLSLGLCLHIGMDYLNSYGVHPFYPFDARWFYGDMVFIVEPLFWVACGVPVFLLAPTRCLRALLVAILLGSLGWFTLNAYLNVWSLGLLVLVAFTAAYLQLRAGPRGRLALVMGLAWALGLIAVQAYAGNAAWQMVSARLHAIDGASKLADIALTAFPTNPLCWNFVAIESNEATGMYRLSRGQLRLWGAPAVACPARFTDINLAGAQQAEPLRIGSRYEGALVDLRRLAREDCKVAAWLRFARAPGLVEGDAVDLRFAATPRGNFTSLPIAELKNSACPVDVPQWAYPRADLLTPGIQ